MGSSPERSADSGSVATSSKPGESALTSTSQESNESSDSPASTLLAGLTRSFLLAAKSLPKGMIQASVKKRAFMTIGQRSASTTTTAVSGGKLNAESMETNRWSKAINEYIKGSVLAISVFGIYDILIYQTLRRNHDNVQTVDGPIGGRQVPIASHSHPANSQIASIQWPPDDDTSGISLWGHFIAGGLAGAAQSIVMSTWEVGRYWWSRRQSRPQHIVSRVNHAFVFRRLIHHSLGYAALFGSYECLRRILFTVRDHYWGAVLMPSLDDHMQDMQTTDQWNNVPLSSLGTAFVAGGFAGQLHYIVDHHTLQWKRQATAKSASQSKRAKSSTTCSSSSSSSSSGTTSNRTTLSPGSLLRASCGSFLPTALCFVAFQYGGELTESLLRKDDNRDELRF